MLNKIYLFVKNVGGAVASPDRTIRVRALTEDDIAFSSWTGISPALMDHLARMQT